MGPIVLTQLATGLSVLAGAALVKSIMDQNNPMLGSGSGGSHSQFPRCFSCNGTGRVSCMCSRWSDGDVGCRTCSGSGRMACSSCGGSGTGRPIPVQLSVRRPPNPNKIGVTRFGELYRGKIKQGGLMGTRDVAVKIWDEKSDYLVLDHQQYGMVFEEVIFLTHPSVNHHPNLIKLIGYCCEDKLKGVVYDVNPLNSLHNYLRSDDFKWMQRIKVALGFARILEFLHGQEPPYLFFNIDAAHVLLDRDCNPLLFDFGLLSGGIVGDMHRAKVFYHMPLGYCDPHYAWTGRKELTSDVYSYGVILFCLICKTLDEKENIGRNNYEFFYERARRQRNAQQCIIHSSLTEQEGYCGSDGDAMMDLAMSCVEDCVADRPTMKEVVKRLESLSISGAL